MSLALCLGWDDFVAEEVPGDVRVEPLPDGRHVVDPWPFAGAELSVRCEGRRLTGRYETEPELHAALREAPLVELDFTLVPRP